MNRIYRSIWNQATGAYAAVSENVKSAGKRSLPGCSGGGAHFALTSMAAALMLGYGSLALAGPAGGTVVAGQATINGAPGATVIRQGSQNAVINWANFNINKGESVQFVQPNSNAVALNRVLGSDGTTILGNLSANGKVFIVNPNGVLFGQGASVNTAGLVASTLDISNSDFMSGKYQFSGNGTGKVLNQGSISAPGGYVALLGANVSNEGTIQARLGSVALAAGRAITLDVAGDGLLNVAVNAGAVGALVSNGGMIKADGGSVVLTAQAAGDLLKTVVNNTGVIEAQTIDTRSGTIKLLGDMQSGTVNAGGTLDASAPTGGKGGFIDTSAAHVNIADGITVTAKAANGLSGTWLIDPVDFTIAASGGNISGTTLTNSLKAADVQIWSTKGSGGTAGDINVNDVVSWTANKLTLTAQNSINVNAAMRGTGTASLALEYGQQAVAAGNNSVYNVKAAIDLPSGNSFSTKLGSDGTALAYTVINSLGDMASVSGLDLQGMRGNLTRNYALGGNIDASSSAGWNSSQGFTPVGNATTAFTGKFDGLGHDISGLTMVRTSQLGGLFGEVGTAGVVRNVNLVGASFNMQDVSYGGFGAGMLAGRNRGLIDNVNVSGTMTTRYGIMGGGLVGQNFGTINNSSSSGAYKVIAGSGYGGGGLVYRNQLDAVVQNSSSSMTISGIDGTTGAATTATGLGGMGGLVRNNLGRIANSFATGAINGNASVGGLVGDTGIKSTITASFATGAVLGSGSVGGLVGNNTGAISNSYATGNVGINNGTGSIVGGLVGTNRLTSGSISNSYATGNVSGYRTTGGVSGSNSATINNVYSTGTVTVGDTAYNRSGGVVGDNSAGTLTNGYYNTTANAVLPGVGFAQGTGTMLTGTTGLSAAAMLIPASFTSFSFTSSTGAAGNNWVAIGADGTVNGSGGTRPMLSAEYSGIINSVHQLQLMALNVAGTYRIGNSFSAAATSGGDVWGTGGFIPVGTSALPFIGSLNGAGRIISSLTIAKSGVSNVGLFGVIGAAGTVANVGLSGGAVTGSVNVGALAGTNQGTVSGSFATSAVVGDSGGGGLVGNNIGSIKDSYASGSVGGNNTMGGLVGTNTGSIASSYANGAVSTGSVGGGLVATGKGSVTGSYWDTTTSGQSTSVGGTGMTSGELKTLANYNSATGANGSLNPAWELSNMWAVYDGQSAPLLRSFMKPLVVTVSKDTKVYDGLAASSGTNSVTYSNVVDSSLLFGTTTYAGSSGGAVNAGTYVVSASGQYSTTQLGYAVTYIDGGLVITPRQLSLTGVSAGSKVYDGTTSAVLAGGSISGVLAADQGNVIFNAASMIGDYASKNVGNNLAVSASGGLSGSASANYALGPLTGVTGNITPKALTISDLAATTRQYDGGTAATLTGGTLTGLIGGETLSLGTSAGAYADKNAGAGKVVTVTVGALTDGTGLASNYTLDAPTGVTGTITAKTLTWTNLAVENKEYDGNATAAINKGSITGYVSGEGLISGSTAAFADKNAGNNKVVTVHTTLGNGSGGGLASNYTLADTTLTSSITPKALTVTGATAGNKVYDGNTAATISGGALSGMIGSETVGLGALSGAFGDKNAGTSKAVTVSGGALSDGSNGGLASNYTLGGVTGLLADITQKALTVSGVSVASKSYDGNTKATISGGTLNGLVIGETLSLSGQSGAFNDKDAGNGKAVTVTGATLADGTGLASNYTVSNATDATGNITPKALTVTGASAVTRVYDGTTAATLAGGVLDGLVSGETLTLSGLSGAYATKNAGSGKAVTVTGATLADNTGGLASNYTVSNPTSVTGNVTKASISSVSGLSASDKTYDGSLAAMIGGKAVITGMVVGDDLAFSSASGAFSDQNAGTGKTVNISGITLTGNDLANYNFTNASATATASIARKALTVIGATAANRVYDGSTAATISGGSLDGLVGKETLTLTSMTGLFADKNVGTAKAVTVSGAALTGGANGGLASNYTVTDSTGLTANITKATISTVSNIVADSKVYDANTKATVSATGATFNGMVGGDSLSISATSATFADKNAGNGKTVAVSGIALSGLDAGNYNLTSTIGSGTGAITPKALTITGMSAVSKAYDGNTKASVTGGSISGLVGSETLGVTGLSVTFNDKNAGTGKAVTATGTTLVNGGNGGLASNYTMANPTDFTANITPKALTVSGMTAGTRVYDGTTAATLAGGSLTGLVTGETLVVSGGTGVFGDKNAGNGKAVTVSGVSLADGTGLASNYSVTNPTNVTGSITQKALSVTGALAADKTYDGALDATITGGSLSGFVGSEAVGLASLTGAFADKNAGAGKAVSVTGGTLSNGSNGGLASNYSVGPVSGLSASIAQKALSVTGVAAANKVYDGTTKASVTGGSLSGLVGGETLGLSGLSGAFGDKNAGTGKAITVSGAQLADGTGLASNYTLSNPTDVTANINQATISSVTNVVADSKVYDGGTSVTFATATATFNGMVSGDSLAIGATKAAFSDKNAGTGKAVTISSLTLGGLDAANYTLASSTATGTGSITPKALTITGMSAVNKVYDGSTKATLSGGSISGLVGMETLGVTGLSAAFDTKDAGTGKTVTATGSTLVNGGNGGQAANYTISNPSGLIASITPKALTVTGMTAGTRVYDGTNAATLSGGALSGLVSGETLVVSGGSGVFADKNAGNGKAVTVSGVGIADGTGLASNYSVSNPTSVTGNITQKALSVTGALAADKTYDGALDATITGGSLSGFVGSEAVGLASLTGAFADKNAGAGKAVSVTGGTLSNGSNGGLASNYSVGPVSGLSASIAQKAVSVTGVAAANKVYDGTTKASVTGGSLSGLVGGETLGLSGLSGAFGDKNAGTGKAITVSGAQLADGTGLASNYTVGNPTDVTANINQATISSVTNVVADSKVYDGGTSVTFAAATATFNGMVSGDSLAIGATKAAFSDKNAGTGKGVTISSLTLGGLDAANYTLASSTATGTGSITPKALTITGMSAVNKIYDGSTKATLSGGSISGLVGSETLGVTGLSATFDTKDAGTGKTVTATGSTLVNGGNGGLASNYTMANPTGFTANITPKALTVSGMTAGTRAYDGTTAATLAGGSLSGLVTGETLVVSGGTGAFGDKNAGNGKAVTVSGVGIADGTGLASNYSVSNPTSVTGNITQKVLMLTGALAADKTYDGALDATITGGTLNGLVGSETVGLADLAGAFVDKNAGSGKAVSVTGGTLSNGSNGGLASNYTVSNPTGLTASITAKALTVAGQLAGNKVYDGNTAAQLSGGVLAGLVAGESLGLAGQTASFADKNAANAKAVTVTGTTLVDTASGLASNYTVSNPTGLTASITAKALTVTGQLAGNKVYDGNTAAQLSGGVLAGLVAGESLGLAGQTASFADKNAANAKAVTVTGTTLVDTASGLASNYTVSNPTGLTASITAKALMVTGQLAGNKVYDGNTAAQLSGGVLAGLVAGESLDLAGQTASFADKNAANGKAVTVTGTSLVDTASGLGSNYTVSNPTGLTASITPKALTVAGQLAGNKVYDGNTAAQLSGGVLAGLVAGESLSLAGQTATFADKNAANGKAVTVSGTTLVDTITGLASNYTVSNPTGLTASITAKALTVTGQLAGNKVYDGNAQTSLSGGALSGLVAGETLGLAGQTATFADKNAANGKAVTVSGTTLVDTASGLASNYTVSNPTGLTASITAKALTVTGQLAGNKVYDGNTQASLSGGALSGLVAGETLGIGGQSAVFSDKNAATAKAVTVTGTTLVDTASGLASNYTVSNPTGLTASITAKALTVAGQLAGSKVYDGNTAAQLSGGVLAGLVAGESLGLAGQTASFADKNAANAKAVTVTGTTLVDTASGLASNYTVSNPTGLTASITAKALMVTGQLAGSKVYDGNAQASLSGGALSGLVAGEALGIVGQTAVFSDKNAANGKTVSVSGTTLVDTITGLASNYTVSNPSGLTASITAKALTVAGQLAGSKVYDGNTAAQLSGGVLAGLVAGESLGLAGQTASFADKNAANGKTVSVSGTTLVDTITGLASNYTVSNPTGLTASITAKALTVTGQLAGNKVYDGNAQASLSGGALSGLVAGESLGLAGQTASFADKNAANAKAVTVTGTTLVDTASGLASNYTVSNPTGLTASITPASLLVRATGAAPRVYDTSTNASVTLADNRIAGDVLSISNSGASFADKNAGANKTVTVNGIVLSGTDAGNYTVNATATTTASITQAALEVKVGNAEKDQGFVNPAFTASYTGLLGNDTLANEVSGNLAFSTPASIATPSGSYLVSAAGQTSTNYALTYTPGVLTVKPTEALQSAVASVIAAVNVAPSQGNMVQAEVVAKGETVTSKEDAVQVALEGRQPQQGSTPVVLTTASVNSNVLPGLRLSVVDTGLRLPVAAGNTSIESQ